MSSGRAAGKGGVPCPGCRRPATCRTRGVSKPPERPGQAIGACASAASSARSSGIPSPVSALVISTNG